MVLKSINLKNFRLHKNTELHFSDDLNFIVGGNGQGKTTILEAIYYLCTTKSLNQSPDIESLNFNEDIFEINGNFSGLTKNITRIVYNRSDKKKTYLLDDKQIYRAASIIGKFPVVVIVQSDHAITMGSPSERRKFIDSVISQSSETYLKILLEYSKTLRQRSSLLSRIREERRNSLYDELDAWTGSLLKIGSEIVKHRMEFVKEFNSYLKTAYSKIMEEIEIPLIEYDFLNCKEEKEIITNFKLKLDERRDEEIRRASNLIGPHRDDFVFQVNNKPLKKFGSQGQHKTFQIALRFGQYFYIKDRLGRNPIFLMDDVFGELDTFRSKKISDYLKSIGQAFITMTDFSNIQNLNIEEHDKVIKIDNGQAVYAQ